MHPSQEAAIKRVIDDPNGAVDLGKQVLKNATMEECSLASLKHKDADAKIMEFVQNLMIEHSISRSDMGKMLIGIGTAAWASEICLERETASN